MLKLEKTSNLSGLTISMRERERFLEPRLVKALLIALFLHIGAIVLFQVTPFYIPSTFSFSPVQVNSDRSFIVVGTHVTSHPEEEETPFPPISFIPALNWISLSRESTFLPSTVFDPHATDSLEEHFRPKWDTPLSLKLEEPRIQLAISGDIASLSLIKRPSALDEKQPISFYETPLYVIYQVQLDKKTGELFWWDRTESSGNKNVDHLTETLLPQLRFREETEIQEIKMIDNFESRYTPLASDRIEGTINFVILPEQQSNSKK